MAHLLLLLLRICGSQGVSLAKHISYRILNSEHPVVGSFAVVVAEDLWFTGWFIGQAYFLAGLEHPVVDPFAVVAVVVAEDLIVN